MTELRIWSDNGQHYIDLYDNEPPKTNIEFRDAREFDKGRSEFSSTFRVPATDNNVDMFGQFFNPNSTTFNPKLKYRAELSYNTIPIIRGHAKMTKTYIQKGQFADFEVTIFGEVADLIRDLGEKKLADITTLSDYDHEINYTNFNNSQSDNLFSGDVVYMLADRGQLFSENGESGTRPIYDADFPLYAGDFIPNLRLKAVIDKIFEDAGFQYDSNFFDSDYFSKLYIPFWNGTEAADSEAYFNSINFNVGLPSDYDVTGYTPGTVITIANQSESTPYFDNGGNYTVTGTGGYYTAPHSGDFQFQINVYVETDTTNPNGLISGNIRVYDITEGSTIWLEYVGYEDTQYSFFPLLPLVEGHEYDIRFRAAEPSITEITFKGSTTVGDPITGWRLVDIGNILYGQDWSPSFNAPDFRQADLIRSIARMFNLVFIYDYTTNKIKIEPYANYVASGDVLDWTQKLDIGSDYSIESTAEQSFLRYEFTYTKDGDYLNTLVQEQGQRVYGRFEYNDENNDWGSQILKVESLTSPTPLNAIPGTNVIIPKFFDQNGDAIETNCRILYRGDAITTENPIKIYNDSTSSVTDLTEYIHFGHYSKPIPEADDEDLNFGAETPFHTITANPINNLFFKYWREYMNDLFSRESRILRGKFYLTATDIQTLSLADTVWVKDALWRVNKITNYSPENELTDVELVKIVSSNYACNLVPVSSNLNGTLNWEDQDGNSETGTETCCNAYGYYWDGSTCYSIPPSHLAPTIVKNSGDIASSGWKPSQTNGNLFGGHGNVQGKGANDNIAGGQVNEIAAEVQGVLMGGANNLANDSYSIIAGVGAKSLLQGKWFGGSLEQSRAMWGEFLMTCEGDLTTLTEALAYGGERIVMENNSVWFVEIDAVVLEINPVGGLSGWYAARYYQTFYKSSGTAGLVAGHGSPHEQQGSFSALDLTVDTTTDTTQHRIKFQFTGGSTPSNDCKLTARVKIIHVK